MAKQRSKTKGPNGEIQYYYCWKYTFIEENKQKGRTFSFWLTGQLYESYLQAIGFALNYEPSLQVDKIDDYFDEYIRSIDMETFQNFVKNSDVRLLKSHSDKLILKNRYLRVTSN